MTNVKANFSRQFQTRSAGGTPKAQIEWIDKKKPKVKLS
jgi:hypothetical protein